MEVVLAMKLTDINKLVTEFYCPYTQNNNLTLRESEDIMYLISHGGKKYKILDQNIIEFCSLEDLKDEEHKLREVNGIDNAQKLYQGASLVNRWNDYRLHCRMAKLKLLTGELFKSDISTLVFLGAGAATEITQILDMDKEKKIKRILASDISVNACKIIAERLEKYDIEATIFSSDIDYCPVKKSNNYPIVICDALHHTPDMHESIDRLLQYGYKNIYFVEPANNFIVKLLEKFGLARRKEYSGCIPGRLEIKKLKLLASNYKYKIKINTLWEFPEDYYRKIFGKIGENRAIEACFLAIVDLWSYMTNYVKIGNFAIVHLEKV